MADVTFPCDSIAEVGGVFNCTFDSALIQTESFSELIALLSFDLETFSVLMGTCTVIFILSYAGGLVVRNMLRV